MQKSEPVILSSGLNEGEVLEWMRGKVSYAAQLESARQYKETLLNELVLIEEKISNLTQASLLEILPKD